MHRSNLLSGLLWTAPWWLGFLLFLATPMAISLYISFCDYSLLQPPVWVGGANYARIAHDPIFFKALTNNLIYAALAIPSGTIAAIALAVLLNQRVRGQAFFRACIFLPTIIPLVAIGVVWAWMLNPETGLVNQGLELGLGWLVPAIDALPAAVGDRLGWLRSLADGPLWLDTPLWAMLSLVLISLWMIGSPVVIYLAGLQEIPESLYEAAELDGAGPWGRFRHVTLPGLSPAILFNVVIAIIAAWQVFALPFVMWQGTRGPDGATYFYTMYLYDKAFRYLDMGFASAMAWIQFAIILLLTALVFAVSRRTVHYGA